MMTATAHEAAGGVLHELLDYETVELFFMPLICPRPLLQPIGSRLALSRLV